MPSLEPINDDHLTVGPATSISPLESLISAELQRIQTSRESISSQDGKSRRNSAQEKQVEIEKKIAELKSLQQSVESMLESAVFIVNYLERLQIQVENVAKREARL